MMASAKLSNSFHSHESVKDCEDNAAPSDSDSDSFVSCVEELEDLTEGSPFEGFDVEGHGRTDNMDRQFKSHTQATANRNVVSEIASTQTKHQQKPAESSGVHILGGSAQAMALLAVRAKHYVTPESVHAWETASVTKQPASHPPSAAGRGFVLAGGFPNDPYYQKYGEPTSGDQAELDGNSQTERNAHVVTDVKGRGSKASYRQHPSDVAAGTKSHSQSGWVDEEQTSDSSPSVYSESISKASGQASCRQHEGNPCDRPVQLGTQYAKAFGPNSAGENPRTIVRGPSAADFDPTVIRVLGWKEEPKGSAQEGLANPSHEAAYEKPHQYVQYEWEDEYSQGLPYQYNTAEASDDGCICQHLMQVLQDWCNMTHGTGATDEKQIASVPDLLDFLKNSFSTSHASESDGLHSIDPHTGQKQISPEDIPVCPEDGFPDLSAQSQCNECWTQYLRVNSILRQDLEHTADPHMTLLDKETRNAMNKANRTLIKLKGDIESALKVASEDNRQLDKTITRMDAHKEQVECAMESHVRRLHEMVDNCHKIAVGDFTKGHNQCKTQVEKEKKKVEKFSSHLSNLQTEIQDKFTEIKTYGLAATKTVKDTRSKYYALLARKPEIQTPVKPTYSFAEPSYTDKEIASMVGCIKITKNVSATTPSSQPPNSHSREPPRAQPTNTTANGRDNSRAPLATATSTPMLMGVKKDSGLSTPAASMESLYSRSSEKNSATSSLGQKDKLSAFMVSASSVASSASSATKKRKRKMKNKAGKQTECQDPYGYIRKESTERTGPKPQKITVKHNSSPNIVRLKGPEPKAIAPTVNGNVWMVYGNTGPQLQRMEADGNLRENIRVGGNAMAVVCLESELVLLASHSPRAHLKLIDKDRKQSDVHDLKVTPFSISVGKTGVVVAGRKALCWVFLSDWKTEWIVPEKDSPLKHVCSTAVTFLQGQELICAADKSDNAVHFYLKDDATGFSTLRSYYGRSQSKGLADTLTEVNYAPEGAQFIPVSVSAHPAGFVAILDSAFNSVHVLNVEHSHQAVSVIPGSELYRSGIPSLIAFGYSDSSDAHLKLWTVGKIDGGECFVCHTPLKFQY